MEKERNYFGIIGHLDVVPVGDGWTFEPFNPVVSDGKLYGRGTTDDKGPVIAALYAMKSVMDTCKVDKRVRLIVGLNEEQSWKCINHYKEVEEMPTLGFSPDADFPCIYAEKGLLSLKLSQEIKTSNEDVMIEDIDYKNNAINIVPKYCSMLIKFKNNEILEKIKSDIINEVNTNKFDIKIKDIDDNKLLVESYGKAAHAAHPELGINAIMRLVVCISNVFSKNNIQIEFIDIMADKLKLETNGKGLGIDLKDDMGELTFNVAKLYISDNKMNLEANMRVPVTYKLSDVEEKITNNLEDMDIEIEFKGRNNPLYIPKDNELVQKLCKIYNDYYGRNEEPIAIGGATYARAFKNCVSFGAMMPNEEDMCHKADEYIKVQNLIDSSKIYARAIYELTR
ncbi:MAG: M20 family metallopeptidase [Clostridia bacterium]|nr:M20 family metallopeptidase [Clostridia bacterium]